MQSTRLIVVFIAPLALFFAVGSLISDEHSEPPNVEEEFTAAIDLPNPTRHLIVIATRVALMSLAIGIFASFYLRTFPLQIDRWSVLTGLAGSVLWILVCELQLESWLLRAAGLSEYLLGARSSVNPFVLYPDTAERALFFVLRFALLVIAVPIAEELFLRGFLMRALETEEWPELSLKELGRTGLIAGTVYGMLSHPGEWIAAGLWFTLLTYLMVRTGRFWNCVVAHAVTNLALGIYILSSGSWHLW